MDPNGTALLFDIKTGQSPRTNALKCRREKTAKKPFNIKISFKSALGPVIGTTNALQNTLNLTQDQKQQERKLFSQQIDPEQQNQTEIDKSSPVVANKLKDYLSYITVHADKDSQSVNEDTANSLKINFTRGVGEVQVTLSATGSACPTLANRRDSLCKTKSSATITSDTSIGFTNTAKQAGTTNMFIDLCVPSTSHCVHRSLKIEELP